MTNNPIRSSGLTLIELLITLALVGILVASATPSLAEFIQNNRAVAQINDLHRSLSMARNEAIKRNSNITVCRSSNGTSCTGDWDDGWIVFVDTDSDGAVDNGELVLSVHEALTGGNTLAFSQTHVIYTNTGLARDHSNATFFLCDARGTEKSLGVIVGPSGRARLASPHDLESFLESDHVNNSALACS